MRKRTWLCSLATVLLMTCWNPQSSFGMLSDEAGESDTTEMEVFQPYDVPLDHDLQEFIYQQCCQYDIPMELVLAMIEKESSYRADVISKTNDYGLMQINLCNHSWLRKELGIQDFLNPRDNVTAGIYMLNQNLDTYGDTNKALMAYNMGAAKASRLWNQGIYSSKYSRSVITLAGQITERK